MAFSGHTHFITLFILDSNTLSNSKDPDENHEGHKMQHFTKVCTVCSDKNNLQGQKYIILSFFLIVNPL